MDVIENPMIYGIKMLQSNREGNQILNLLFNNYEFRFF